MAFATTSDLTEYLGSSIDDAARLLDRASEVIEDNIFVTYDIDEKAEALKLATCAQVEYWTVIKEKFAISGYKGNIKIGDASMEINYDELAPRAERYLYKAGLLYRGTYRY